jgi:hypothetical protein
MKKDKIVIRLICLLIIVYLVMVMMIAFVG